MVITSCCVHHCHNKAVPGTTFSFHHFPWRNPELLTKWVVKVNRKYNDVSEWRPSRQDRVCSAHFLEKDYFDCPRSSKRVLRKHVVPSVFPNDPIHKKPAAVTKTRRSSSKKRAASQIQPKKRIKHFHGVWMEVDDPFTYILMDDEVKTQQPEKGLIELQSFQLRDRNVKMLVEEYQYLYDMIQRLKDLARINMDLLYLSMEDDPEVQEELDKVKEMVHCVMNGREVYHLLVDSEKNKDEAGIQDSDMDVGTKKCNERYNSTLEQRNSYKHEAELLMAVKALHENLAQLAPNLTEQEVVSTLSKVFQEEILIKALNGKTPNVGTGQVITPPSSIQTEGTSSSLTLQAALGLCGFSDCSKELGREINVDNVTQTQSVCSDVGEMVGDDKDGGNAILSADHGAELYTLLTENKKEQEINLDITGYSYPTVGSEEKSVLEHQLLNTSIEQNRSITFKANTIDWNSTLCSLCGRTFKNRRYLLKHLQIHEDLPQSYICDVCGKTFKFKDALLTHIRTTHETASKACPICGKKMRPNNLKRHMDAHTGNKPFVCSICHKQFAQKSSLKGHQMMHGENFEHQCSLCDKGFPFRCMLDKHVKKNLCRQFSCVKCGTTFKYNHSLQEHADVCDGISENAISVERTGRCRLIAAPREEPYICSVCQQRFQYQSSFASHLLIFHSRELDRCLLCNDDEVFTSFEDFELHLKNVHLTDSVKPFMCGTCGESFYTLFKLSSHRKLHKDKLALTCKDCGKSCSSYQTLKCHRFYAHSVELPCNSCDICGKQFVRGSSLRKHKIVHSGLRPFKCLVCGATFPTKDGLKLHSWTHSNRKKYQCQMCEKGFNDRRNYLSHVTKWHQGDRER